MKEVADVLREYQFKNRLTQHNMAKFLGVAQSTYNNWVNEQARVNPLKYYEKIAKLCEIEVGMILPKNIGLENQKGNNVELESLLNALEFCKKYSKNLEEMNESLRKENGKLIIVLEEKETIIELLEASR